MIESKIVNNTYTELYVNGGGNFITQNYPVDFHTFTTRLILTDGDCIDNYREVTPSEKAAIEASDKAWQQPSQEFNDLFRSVFTANIHDKRVELGKYDFDNAPDKSKPYRVYDDEWLSYEDAMQSVANASAAKGIGEHFTSAIQAPCAKVLPPFILPNGNFIMSMVSFARGNTLVEVVYFAQGHPSLGSSKFNNIKDAFAYNSKLRKVLYLPLSATCTASGAFTACYQLEETRIAFACNLDFRDCSKLSPASMEYGVQKGGAVTVTVHADVYAKLTGDTTNAAAAALSEEELTRWQAILAAAENKNLIFATI